MLVDVAAGFDFHHGTGQLGEILAAFDQLIRLVIGGLHAYFEAEDARRRVLGKEIQHLRTHNIRCNLELEHTALMVVDQELEHLHRIAAVDVEGAVQELDNLGSVVDQIEQIRLHPLNIVIAYADLNTR
ncbi:hypothetical protein D3C86_1758920 [compost metagenome]